MHEIIIDGALLSEISLYAGNTTGIHRVAEEILKVFLNENKYEIGVYNSKYSTLYEDHLQNYLNSNHLNLPLASAKVFFSSSHKNLIVPFRIISKIFKSEVNLKPEVTKGLYHSFFHPIPKKIRKSNLKITQTIHDIIPLLVDGYDGYLVNTMKSIMHTAHSNAYIFADSEYSRLDILNYDGAIDPSRIIAAPLAANELLFYPDKSLEKFQAIKDKYDLPENYFLTVSSNDKRKNIPHLIMGFRDFLLSSKAKDIYLVLAGNSKVSKKVLLDLNLESEVLEKICIPSKFIDNEDLAVLYSNALAFFYVSLYEGFGLPALEAMQCGTPTIASSTTSLPEVVGDAGIQVDPTNVDDLVSAMATVYENETMRKSMSNLGLERAKNFSWQKTADIYASKFDDLLS